MTPLPGALLSKMAIDAELMRRLHAEDPFFCARAERYAQLDDAMRAHETSPEPAGKYLAMFRKRREIILLELVDLIAEKSQTKTDTLWKVP
jgi:uncharacterized protein YdcH (DUF465 family)